MSGGFYAVSKKMKLVLNLGKLVCYDEDGEPVKWQFTGWIDHSTRNRTTNSQLWDAFSHFIAHLGYHHNDEAIIVDERMLNSIVGDDDFDDWHYLESISEVFELPTLDDL
ncbi:hypothetical protein [Deinococcus peraridilitoris]|uniref:Uncharacterized protein n=1 Tax=Deinococcus peraridilitoris (strain DSM 19664 / LMG 22246 / CIP 109416 / KR-200) TaxID=937777 RepID=L0A205_DEIPD|nr:hypothetical protein [Deinococcus peraridilitoris]AFZ67192.1 hypothetical protein Deipe_1659 [Deinococcus peraridilitoris DSM 19664]